MDARLRWEGVHNKVLTDIGDDYYLIHHYNLEQYNLFTDVLTTAWVKMS